MTKWVNVFAFACMRNSVPTPCLAGAWPQHAHAWQCRSPGLRAGRIFCCSARAHRLCAELGEYECELHSLECRECNRVVDEPTSSPTQPWLTFRAASGWLCARRTDLLNSDAGRWSETLTLSPTPPRQSTELRNHSRYRLKSLPA